METVCDTGGSQHEPGILVRYIFVCIHRVSRPAGRFLPIDRLHKRQHTTEAHLLSLLRAIIVLSSVPHILVATSLVTTGRKYMGTLISFYLMEIRLEFQLVSPEK